MNTERHIYKPSAFAIRRNLIPLRASVETGRGHRARKQATDTPEGVDPVPKLQRNANCYASAPLSMGRLPISSPREDRPAPWPPDYSNNLAWHPGFHTAALCPASHSMGMHGSIRRGICYAMGHSGECMRVRRQELIRRLCRLISCPHASERVNMCPCACTHLRWIAHAKGDIISTPSCNIRHREPAPPARPRRHEEVTHMQNL